MDNSKKQISESWIEVYCCKNANPKNNKLQLRTEPPTFIELQPGVNTLRVEDYPALKYGFSQIEKPYIGDGNYNCGDIHRIDLSHFNASEMTTMDGMFRQMVRLSIILFSVEFPKNSGIGTKNITSMGRAFELMGSECKEFAIGRFDLTHIDFSQVVSSTNMLYGCSSAVVDLTGCDMSNICKTTGMFEKNNIKELVLDNASLSKEVIEEMRNADWSALKSVSMKGCSPQMIESVVNNILESRPSTCPRVRVILDEKTDNEVLNFYAPKESWISKHRNEWYATLSSGCLRGSESSEPEILYNRLKKENLLEEIETINYGRLYKVGYQFPSNLLKSYFVWYKDRKTESCKLNYFIVGNYYAAFSNNPDIKFYVPVLHEGYETIEKAVEALYDKVKEDLSSYKIITIQYLDPNSIPNELHRSEVWEPYTSSGEFNINVPYKHKDKFNKALDLRICKIQTIIKDCLVHIAEASFNRLFVCTDHIGQQHLLNATKIVDISIPDVKGSEMMPIVTVFMEGTHNITVDLITFTSEFANYHYRPKESSVSSSESALDVIPVVIDDLTEIYQRIEDEIFSDRDEENNADLDEDEIPVDKPVDDVQVIPTSSGRRKRRKIDLKAIYDELSDDETPVDKTNTNL